MNDRASSIHVGEGVWVWVFEHAHFAGKSLLCKINDDDLVRPDQPIRTPQETTPTPVPGNSLRGGLGDMSRLGPLGVNPNFNDLVSSMIIVPKATSPPRFGVALIRSDPFRGGDLQVFYPLPERLTDLEARYPNLHWMDMNDKAKIVWLYGSVEVTLYEHANFDGNRRTLPGAGAQGEFMRFYLDRYQFDGIVSSLKVRQRK
jgi:hypothetical protein